MRRRLLLFGALSSMAACIGLKADDPPRAGDSSLDPFDRSSAGREGREGLDASPPEAGGRDDADSAVDGHLADNGPSIASVPDERTDDDFTTTLDGVVVDEDTALRWKRDGDAFRDSFADAKKYCAELRTEFADDWRLPTKLELLAIADFMSTRTLSTWPSAFADAGGPWWTSAEVTGTDLTPRVWVIDMTSPGIGTSAPESHVITRTRCVRGPKLARATFVREGDLVRDTLTGREWERTRSPDAMSVKDGASRCAALRVGGKSGFRLPRAKELLSLLDDTLPSAPFDDAIFPAPRGGRVMTGTLRRSWSGGVGGVVHAVDFDSGDLYRSEAAYVRCVR